MDVWGAGHVQIWNIYWTFQKVFLCTRKIRIFFQKREDSETKVEEARLNLEELERNMPPAENKDEFAQWQKLYDIKKASLDEVTLIVFTILKDS